MDRANRVHPILCRMATVWRSGRTPAEPYPPDGRCILAEEAPRGQQVTATSAGGTKALNSGDAGAEPLRLFPGRPNQPDKQENNKIYPLVMQKSH